MDIITLFNQHNTGFGIIAGDFSCCLDSNLDKSSSIISNRNASTTLRLASMDIGMVDVWRELNPTKRDYTFYSARHKSYSRLDLLIRGQPISYTAAKKKSFTKKTEQLKRELINLEQSHKHSPYRGKLEKTECCQNQSQTEHIKKTPVLY